MKLTSLLGLLTLSGSLWLSNAATAGEKIFMATSYPDTNFHTQLVKQFVAKVNEKTQRELEIEVHSNSTLIRAPQIIRSVRMGQIKLGERIISSLSNQDPVFTIDSLPFLINSYDDAWRLYMASKPLLEKRLDEMGLKLLYTVPWPPQGIFAPGELQTLKELRGKRFRTYDQFTTKIAVAVGSDPVKIDAYELPQAFATGMVDVMFDSGGTVGDLDLYRYRPVWYNAKAWMPKNMVFINKDYWVELTPEKRQAFREAAAEIEAEGWNLSRSLSEKFAKNFSDNGVKVIDPANTPLGAELRSIGSQIINQWKAQVPAEYAQVLIDYQRSPLGFLTTKPSQEASQ